jgi:sugar O-acyltransferase (sialic acid O-acetyltransferase NeuD family)
MATDQILLYGASGHAKVVLDALIELGIAYERISVADDDSQMTGAAILGSRIQHAPDVCNGAMNCSFHVAIGDARIRKKIFDKLQSLGASPLTIAHPGAIISRFAVVGVGTFIAARAIVGPSSTIGIGSIVNHSAVVDHDCSVGDFTHIAPSATLGGNVRIGSWVLVGAGAVVLRGLSIGDGSIIGAGAVVMKDVPPNETWIGIPAVEMTRR